MRRVHLFDDDRYSARLRGRSHHLRHCVIQFRFFARHTPRVLKNLSGKACKSEAHARGIRAARRTMTFSQSSMTRRPRAHPDAPVPGSDRSCSPYGSSLSARRVSRRRRPPGPSTRRDIRFAAVEGIRLRVGARLDAGDAKVPDDARPFAGVVHLLVAKELSIARWISGYSVIPCPACPNLPIASSHAAFTGPRLVSGHLRGAERDLPPCSSVEISLAHFSCMRRFPTEVVSVGPAITGMPMASAVHWQSVWF